MSESGEPADKKTCPNYAWAIPIALNPRYFTPNWCSPGCELKRDGRNLTLTWIATSEDGEISTDTIEMKIDDMFDDVMELISIKRGTPYVQRVGFNTILMLLLAQLGFSCLHTFNEHHCRQAFGQPARTIRKQVDLGPYSTWGDAARFILWGKELTLPLHPDEEFVVMSADEYRTLAKLRGMREMENWFIGPYAAVLMNKGVPSVAAGFCLEHVDVFNRQRDDGMPFCLRIHGIHSHDGRVMQFIAKLKEMLTGTGAKDNFDIDLPEPVTVIAPIDPMLAMVEILNTKAGFVQGGVPHMSVGLVQDFPFCSQETMAALVAHRIC